MIRPAALVLVLAAGLAASCDRPAASPASRPAPVLGSNVIEGVVRFDGIAPPLPMIDTGGTCRDAKAIQSETLVINRDGGLRDVVVWLDDAPASDGGQFPPALLDQVGCRYVPHVVAVQTGQPLRIRSSDSEFHNVHWVNGENPGVNLGFTTPGETRIVMFDQPDFIRARCDVHAWMEAWIAVVPNPFFAVTDSDGKFRIDRVPPGRYHLRAWHARAGERTATVDVADGTAGKVTITYAPPGS